MKEQKMIEIVESNNNSWINSSYGNFCPLA